MNMITPTNGEGALDVTQSYSRKTEIESLSCIAREAPRVFENGQRLLEQYVRSSPESCFYYIPRGGSHIIGPSSRFAFDTAGCFGNIRSQSNVSGITDDHVIATGSAIDLQTNVSTTVEVKRRIRSSDGRRYSDDMIGVTSNAACSIALRNAILKVIPQFFWHDAYVMAQKISARSEHPIAGRIKAAQKHLKGIGVGTPQILKAVGRKSVDEINDNDLVVLRGLANSIKNSEISVEEAFPSGGGVERLNEVINGDSGDSVENGNGKEKLRKVRDDLRDSVKKAYFLIDDEESRKNIIESLSLPNIDAVDSILSVSKLEQIRDKLLELVTSS